MATVENCRDAEHTSRRKPAARTTRKKRSLVLLVTRS
uniref:Uncharacterized protein n=1 Tax=Arundo donax TaxID=35708 RepID=A0A0A9AWX9_ARUDO